ncbi:MAG: CRISPR-associated RAMP protein Csx10 [Jaaginema sp. PMC 1079.18]|nr:CRISPR-associated RAMP protein Csx10 [Jaaginema sp. PMC 1080.18]MEC4849735.1 CRISPR-associated RAMP protein Csx10 [Jaaginema sp. PMC 1079.18]
MKQIKLKISAQSPLAIGHKKPGSVSEASDYIPGSVIRGAVASQILRLSSNPPNTGDDFHKLFIDENAAIFSNAYPATAKYKDNSDNENLVIAETVSVLPATVVSSKTEPGFKPKGHGVFDTLIDRFCAEEFNQFYDPNCPKDGGRVEPFSGFYSQQSDVYLKHSVTKRLLTRVGINRRRATSEEQILYSLEVLDEKLATQNKNQIKQWHDFVYKGKILLENEDLAKQLKTLIEQHQFRLGGSASRGLGKVEIAAELINYESNIETKIKEFNAKLKERLKKWAALFGGQEQTDRTYFTIDLQADAILIDNWKRTTVLTPEMLCSFAQVTDGTLKLHAAYTSYDYVSGWNSAWGLMKDIELVTTKGSVYLFSTKNIELWSKPLATLEQKGLGERTVEGFGQVEICNSFHTICREYAV